MLLLYNPRIEGWRHQADVLRAFQQSLLTLVPSLSILAIMVFAKLHLQINYSRMTRDVTAIAHIHPLSGLLSNLGIILWCFSASVCLFSAILLRNTEDREPSRYLLSAALLTGYLMLDDFFLFHEVLAERYLSLSETIVFAALGMAIVVHLVRFHRVILKSNFAMLIIALGFLFASVFIDELYDVLGWGHGDWEYLLEDGAKWLGICCWCSYYGRTAYHLLNEAIFGNTVSLSKPR